ncbi:hypothetical protein CALVIDRAFT_572371 [Calocera viscosa TUFC12733]|uniref:Uncharacterized protein n=1 Tax=Calocera viscosa (strain TUFC12733) TaxID=1330018 RepID=A0A167FJL1_CALVF|nr:hypothetical protein CALVIDRAFT_572371 [Calocera viscosa TUFC12733]
MPETPKQNIKPYTKFTPTRQAQAVAYHDAGMDSVQIAEKLDCHSSTVRRNVEKYKDAKSFYWTSPQLGHPPAIHSDWYPIMEEYFDTGKARDGEDLRRQLFPDVLPSTIWKTLRDIGLYGRICREKPCIRAHNTRHKTVRDSGPR